ncbi:L,D-transpeptidase [Microbaculum marinum]|uniref:L,D-transpeptidase n=1 Tax=Microbaculum marinum TaxID=1764581 RepID=A0AAW9RTR1_9HYPH
MSRRTFVVGGLSVALAGCTSQTMESWTAYAPVSGEVAPQYRRQRVRYETREKPGTIIVDTSERFLYVVEEGGMATRYGVGVGRAGFSWSGRATVGRKAQWPTWTPPPNMIKRQPELKKYAAGMPGGPDNPLGARALYLYRGGRDTLYRLHGTNQPSSIGQAMSSGCIRMLNADVEHLYDRTPVGTPVVVKV